MNTIRNTAYWLERFNSLVKLQLKIKAESYTDEVKINFAGELPNVDAFKACVGQTIESGKHSDSFIDTINRLLFLSEANSDLMVEGNLSSHQAYNEFCKLSPHIRELDKLSLDVFEFVDEISHYYTGFENRQTELPECRYKEDKHILWPLYHLVSSFVVSCHEQEMIDFQNHLSYLNKSEVNNFIRQQQDERLEEIWESVKGLCDRNIVFNYLEPDSDVGIDYLIYTVVSGFMEKAGVDGYIRYVEFDYTKYKPSFRWDFGKNAIEDYKDLSALPRFNRLVFLLCHILYVKEIEKEERTSPLPIEPVAEISEDSRKPKEQADDYVLDISLLNRIYSEFNDELWVDIPIRKFLNMFTTAIHLEEKFKVLKKERFHYLLKKIWINGEHRNYFDTEKEWIEPFLKHYNLSVSGYWNQSVKNERQVKHRAFISTVDKILPKTERS